MSSWIPWNREQKKEEPPPSSPPHTLSLPPLPAFDTVTERLNALPLSAVALSTFTLGVLATAGTTFVWRRYLRRIPNAEWITPDYFARKRWIKGYVTSVGDADNFRIYHTPSVGWHWLRSVPDTSKELKDKTIHIRLAGVDAPEGAHFGRPAQEHYAQCLGWLKDQVLGKTVYCQLLRRDQYSRVVAMPYLKPRLLPNFLARGRCIPIEMLRAGWGVTYKEGGAQYGDYSVEQFVQLEQEAKAARRGIWLSGDLKETPAAYKRKYAKDAEVAEVAEPEAEAEPRAGIWRRMLNVFGRRS